MDNPREELLRQIWEAQDTASYLISEYDSIPHSYGDALLYQAEALIVELIANNPGITATELSRDLHKTVSACSQLVRKLREKGYVEQTRNENNNRIYNLSLTEKGQKLYRDHEAFTRNCQNITFSMLEEFSEEELRHHLMVQNRINEAYRGDIRRSREREKNGLQQ